MPVEPLAKHRLANGDRLRRIHPVELGGTPGFLIALDNECRQFIVESVAVRLENAVLVFEEVKSERVERKCRSKQDVPCRSRIEVGLEMLGVLPSDSAVDSIGGDDQVCVAEPERIELRQVANIGAESKLNAELSRPLLGILSSFFRAMPLNPCPPD